MVLSDYLESLEVALNIESPKDPVYRGYMPAPLFEWTFYHRNNNCLVIEIRFCKPHRSFTKDVRKIADLFGQRYRMTKARQTDKDKYLMYLEFPVLDGTGESLYNSLLNFFGYV